MDDFCSEVSIHSLTEATLKRMAVLKKKKKNWKSTLDEWPSKDASVEQALCEFWKSYCSAGAM